MQMTYTNRRQFLNLKNKQSTIQNVEYVDIQIEKFASTTVRIYND
jgi:hypothetical protein